MIDIIDIADKADMILNGYAFTKCNRVIRILNLNSLKKAAVLDENGEVLETSMDDIELSIIVDYYMNNKQFMGI